MSETLDESTGIAKRVVIDWRTGSVRGQQDLRPALVIKGKDGKILKLSRGGDARYCWRSTPSSRSIRTAR